jgi:cytochrome c-type biogenesis protein
VAACQAARGRAGASIAAKPQTEALVPSAPLVGTSKPNSRIRLTATGTAIRAPRRSAGPGSLGPIANNDAAWSRCAIPAGLKSPGCGREGASLEVIWGVLAIAVISSDPAAGVGIFAALAAGIVSFLSPCVLPLVPGYLSAVTGVSASELDQAGWRRVLGPSLLFVASFSMIFILLGLTATGLGSTLQDHKETLQKISAALIVFMGVLFVSSLFVTRLNREWHVEALLSRAGRGGPIVAGAAFAIAWTPCIGPTLGAILSAAALADSWGRGAFLLAVYSAGLAIPFIATALAFSRMTTAFAVVKRHYQAIVAVGGVILIAMGILIWNGDLTQLNSEVQSWAESLGIDFWNHV